MEDSETIAVPIISDTGKRLFQIEARNLGGREQVSVFNGIPEDDLRAALEAVGRTIGSVLEKISPTKATAEFAIEIGVESGQLTALLCKGSGKANLKVTLEWSGESTNKSV